MLNNPHIDWHSGNTISWSKECNRTCFKDRDNSQASTQASFPAEEDQFPILSFAPLCYLDLKELFKNLKPPATSASTI